MADEVWTTKDGREIPVADLPDRHLLNIHRMLRQTVENTRSYIGVLGTCWAPRGEMATEAFEQEMDAQLEADGVSRIWLSIIGGELQRRQLTELPLKEPYKPMPKMELVEDLGVGQIWKKKE